MEAEQRVKQELYLATKKDFEDAVAATKDDGKPLVIDFTATWCGPCKQIGPVYDGHVPDFPQLVMKKLDIDANAECKADAGIKSVPTFIVYKNGAEVDRLEFSSEKGLLELLIRAKKKEASDED